MTRTSITTSPSNVRYEITFQSMAAVTANENNMSRVAENGANGRFRVGPRTNP